MLSSKPSTFAIHFCYTRMLYVDNEHHREKTCFRSILTTIAHTCINMRHGLFLQSYNAYYAIFIFGRYSIVGYESRIPRYVVQAMKRLRSKGAKPH